MEQLLQRPQDPDLELEGQAALHAACDYGCVDAARLLLEANADKDKAGTEGATPLCLPQ